MRQGMADGCPRFGIQLAFVFVLREICIYDRGWSGFWAILLILLFLLSSWPFHMAVLVALQYTCHLQAQWRWRARERGCRKQGWHALDSNFWKEHFFSFSQKNFRPVCVGGNHGGSASITSAMLALHLCSTADYQAAEATAPHTLVERIAAEENLLCPYLLFNSQITISGQSS